MCVMSLALLTQSYESNAKDFGRACTTFKIEEQDMLDEIKGKLSDMEKRGIIAQVLTGMERAARQRVHSPKPVEGIRHATENKTRTFDPTYMLTQDMMDQEGRMIHRAGTIINPLDTVGLYRPLIFIDGVNKAQVEWAVRKSNELKGKIILVAGSPIELMRDYQRQFYFDQSGKMTSRLKIQVVPSIVTQEGDVLKLEEIALNNVK